MKENIGSPLLSSEERRLFQILHDEHLHDAKTFNKPSYKGKAHFVYELLQNADDTQATEASFILEEDRLIFRHNGKVGFSISTADERINKGCRLKVRIINPPDAQQGQLFRFRNSVCTLSFQDL